MENIIKTDFATIIEIAEKEGFRIQECKLDGVSFIHRKGMVILSESIELDGKRWLHLSASYRGRLPEYNELKQIKNIFIGKDKKAIQVFPEENKNINIHEFCLHLWHCVDGDGLPDFIRGMGSI